MHEDDGGNQNEKRNIHTTFLSLRLWILNVIVRAVRSSSRFAIVTVAMYGMRASSSFALGKLHEATNVMKSIVAMRVWIPGGSNHDN